MGALLGQRRARRQLERRLQEAGAQAGERVLVSDHGQSFPDGARVQVVVTAVAVYLRWDGDFQRLPYREWTDLGDGGGELAFCSGQRDYLVQFASRTGCDVPHTVMQYAPPLMSKPV